MKCSPILAFTTAALSLLALGAKANAAEPDFSRVPGTVVAHTPASSGIYFGSPGIAVVGDGVYLAKNDEFGPGTTEHQRAVSNVYRSDDRGASWRRVARINGLFWASIFVHGDAVYLLGTEKHHGRIVIMRSDDLGSTWTTATDENHGLLTSEGEYHTAPVPVIVHEGRLWRAIEDAMGGTRWGERYRARILSIPLGADLLRQGNWTLSEPMARDPKWLDGAFGGWLEGNAVVTPGNQIVNVLRVACPSGDKAAVVHVSDDGKSLTFDPDRDFIEFPGGAKKFTIRFDPPTKAYWTLANPVLARHAGEGGAASVRNTLALMRSENLREWQIRCILLYHPDVPRHGFQYPDWLIEGKDMIAAIRTAYDDGFGGAHNAHDANFLTFHRFQNFRTLTMEDSVVEPGELAAPPKLTVETETFTLNGRRFEMATLDNDALAYSNRSYVWQQVPARLRGWQYTRTGGGVRAEISIAATCDTTLYVATASSPAGAEMSPWIKTDDTFLYTDGGRTRMSVFRRDVTSGQTVNVPQSNWTGTLVLAPPDK